MAHHDVEPGAEQMYGWSAKEVRLIENMDDAVVATDATFAVRNWNRGAERLDGWSVDEVLGRRVKDAIQLGMSEKELERGSAGARSKGAGGSELVA